MDRSWSGSGRRHGPAKAGPPDQGRLDLLYSIRDFYLGPAEEGDEDAVRIVQSVEEMIAEAEEASG